MTTYLILLAGLAALFLGGDWLVKGASTLALRFGITPMVVGLTIVGFGTSAPELMVSLNAALGGRAEIAIGNVIGSNIANILLILGLAALITPITVQFAQIKGDLLWMTLATLALPLLFWSGMIGATKGVIMLLALAAYLLVSLRKPNEASDSTRTPAPLWQGLLLTALGLGAVLIGAHYLVESASMIARKWGVSEAIIGLSIVAVGTSLPELATTLMAAVRGARDIALGNVIGSNIFNILCILGVTAVVQPIAVDPRFLIIDTPTLIGATLALTLILWWKSALNRRTGTVMLALYALYIWATMTSGATT
ncbi:calcium/sodium antiporter [Loktanella agnita]|uniref:calcium/sodium antiporter n=1 Tax=Loktanella agnita TaxID=287097 RepID=UPI003986F6BC